MNNYWAESKNVEVLINQIGPNTKIVSAQNESHILFITSQSILMKRGKCNTVGGIFVNYGELLHS